MQPVTINDLQLVADKLGKVVRERGWTKNWSSGGCYIHLEVSEFIESLRGKGKSAPAQEAGDVIVALFAVLEHYDIPVADIFRHASLTVDRLTNDKEFGKRGNL